ncbi:MAG: hypothetical protein KDC48_22570 [Planctomycetes bacterium]|nr:hypothetical protein [Planctomycetota bacterium]
MNDPEQPAAPPTWLLWSFLVLLVVPFHPYWVDFEQLRRALLLLLSGATLLFLPRLRPVAGGFFVSMFVLGLILCAGVNWFADAIGKGEHEAHSFQPMEAGYRLVHWVALMVVLRLGAAAQDRFGKPIAALLLATCAFGLLQRLGLGEIAGYGAATDTHHLTQPHPEGDAALRAMNAACRDAGLRAADIGYLNSHGTGTPLNDVAEGRAIQRWAGADVGKVRVSSTKASIGHLLGGAGAVETVVALMALREGFLPPTTTVETPDPVCTFDLVREPRDAEPRHALTNSFGFGGANATLILSRFD